MAFTDAEYANRKKKPKREQFLDAKIKLLPQDEWVSRLDCHGKEQGRMPADWH